jgi:hypothetical protein
MSANVSSEEYRAANLQPEYAGTNLEGNNENNERVHKRVADAKKRLTESSPADSFASVDVDPAKPATGKQAKGKGTQSAADLSATGGTSTEPPKPSIAPPAWKPGT